MSRPVLAYYPGCSQAGTAAEYDSSTRACCAELGVMLVDVPDWTCCGASPAHAVDHHLAGALAARNLLQAELSGQERIATPCPSCLAALRTASRRLAEVPAEVPAEGQASGYRAAVERLLDRPAPLRADAVSVLQVLAEDVGPAAVAQAVKRPLAGLRVAPYYGCLLSRPPGLMAFDDPENPLAMDRLLTACGATVVDFPFKTECCGAAFGMPRLEVMTRLSARILDMASSCGADVIAVACPLCQMNLDLRQGQVEAASRRRFGLPVPYFTQLLGLALGLDHGALGLDKLVIPLGPALAAADARAAEAAPTEARPNGDGPGKQGGKYGGCAAAGGKPCA